MGWLRRFWRWLVGPAATGRWVDYDDKVSDRWLRERGYQRDGDHQW